MSIEPETSMGGAFYWGASMLAGLLIVLAAINYFYDISEGVPIIPIVPLVIAGVIYLIGRSCRAVLDDR